MFEKPIAWYNLKYSRPHTEYFNDDKLFSFFQTIPFDKVDIKIIQIEMDHVGEIFPGTKDDVEAFMDSVGYRFVKEIGVDHVYTKEGFDIIE